MSSTMKVMASKDMQKVSAQQKVIGICAKTLATCAR